MMTDKQTTPPLTLLLTLLTTCLCATACAPEKEEVMAQETTTWDTPEADITRSVALDVVSKTTRLIRLDLIPPKADESVVTFRVTADEAFMVGAEDPKLQVGDHVLSEYTWEGPNKAILFPAPAQLLAEGGAITFGFGERGGALGHETSLGCAYAPDNHSLTLK